MNYSSLVVRIIKKSKQIFLKNDTSLMHLIVQFPSVRKKNCTDTCRVLIWGNLSYDIMKYYNINDYIIIEGFISVNKNIDTLNSEIEISAFKIYPFRQI